MRDTKPGLQSVLDILTPDLRKRIEEFISNMSEQEKEHIYNQVVALLNEGMNQ